MNHMPLRTLESVAQVRRPTQRTLAKQRTREKILAAARALFTERGYERATIRDIAAAAGMSTGAVFASFNDKSDLFNEIIGVSRDDLHDTVRAAAKGDTTAQILGAMFAAAFDLQLGDLPLAQAAFCAAWSPELGQQVRRQMSRKPVVDLLAEVLRAGVEKGELRAELDRQLVAQMLWDGYIATLQYAAFDGWGLEALKRRLEARTTIILDGVRAG